MSDTFGNFEVVTYKVRPLSHDRKLHVFRFLIKPCTLSFDEFAEKAMMKFDELFPFGYRVSSVERYVVDFELVSDWSDYISELCSHEYLAKYLSSVEKLE